MQSSREFSWLIQKQITSKYDQLLVEKSVNSNSTKYQELSYTQVDENSKISTLKPYLKAPFSQRKQTEWTCWPWTALGTVLLYVQLIFLPSAFSYLETFPLTCLLCTCTLILQSEAVHWKIYESKTKLHNRANKIWGIQEDMEKVRKTIIYWISAICLSL